jgi:diadenosine tetraphosphate (Ap4A) HIT family hydrolase
MFTLIDERVRAANAGENACVVCRVRSGWVVLGDSQFFLGYSLLLPDPVVGSLNSLGVNERIQFLTDMTSVGDALLACTDAYRINYEILGNRDQALHAHVFPHRLKESDNERSQPVWLYPKTKRNSCEFNPIEHGQLQEELRRFLFTTNCAIRIEGVPG